jgi:hypothetical protein
MTHISLKLGTGSLCINSKRRNIERWLLHNVTSVGHPGARRATKLIKQNYWWLYLDKDVEEYVRGCEIC